MANNEKKCRVCNLDHKYSINQCPGCEGDMCTNTFGYYKHRLDDTITYCLLCYLDNFLVYKYTKNQKYTGIYGQICVSHGGGKLSRFTIDKSWLKECGMNVTIKSDDCYELSIDELSYLANKASTTNNHEVVNQLNKYNQIYSK